MRKEHEHETRKPCLCDRNVACCLLISDTLLDATTHYCRKWGFDQQSKDQREVLKNG
ncbi:hypothetical protein LCGC14_0146260 [marine sediment metagenome]|uniref:Uncharacterized protein n=1 Tax=marine sediment metagenome TaxID=412755 RepID=A0A0F9UZX5_9ZZZZ